MPHPGWYRVVLDLTILGKNLKKVYGDQRFYERVYGDKNGKKTIFDFEAVKVLNDTLLKPEEKRSVRSTKSHGPARHRNRPSLFAIGGKCPNFEKRDLAGPQAVFWTGLLPASNRRTVWTRSFFRKGLPRKPVIPAARQLF